MLEIAELDERDWRGAVAAGDPRVLIERFIEEIGFAPTQDAAAAGAGDGQPGSSPAPLTPLAAYGAADANTKVADTS